MKRKQFLTRGAIGLGGVLGLSSLFVSKFGSKQTHHTNPGECITSPKETRGPFPNKTPEDYIRENIIADRVGIPLKINFTILNKNDGCKPLANALIDIWHCDSHGQYSEYGGGRVQPKDLSKEHFLRGRQVSDTKGMVSFTSIFPGHYPGRAPHIHVEILDENEKSLLVTQLAFPEDVCEKVYATENYRHKKFTSNKSDSIFRTSIDNNLADQITGDLKTGFTLHKNLVVLS